QRPSYLFPSLSARPPEEPLIESRPLTWVESRLPSVGLRPWLGELPSRLYPRGLEDRQHRQPACGGGTCPLDPPGQLGQLHEVGRPPTRAGTMAAAVCSCG